MVDIRRDSDDVTRTTRLVALVAILYRVAGLGVQLMSIPDQCVCLEGAARTAGSVICGSLQFQGGVWGANVLTGEQASRLRSSYVNITQAFWDAPDGWRRYGSDGDRA